MKSLVAFCIFCLGLSFSQAILAQLPSNRIRPGTMYYPGDTVHSPRLGLHAVIPDGWEGVLPRDAEVFLLMSVNNVNGQIYVGANERLDKQGQIERWKKGMDLEDGLRLMPDGEIHTRGDIIWAKGKVTGNKGKIPSQFYLEARCSPFGFCLSYMLIADAPSLEAGKKALQFFVDNTTFTKPTNESPYLHFDWKKFLSGKVLLMIDYEQTSKKEDEVNLCGDGSFYSNITRRGLFKDQAKGYQGKKKGTWTVENKGNKATITLSFEKLAPVSVSLDARDEEIYINGSRYFVGTSEKCK